MSLEGTNHDVILPGDAMHSTVCAMARCPCVCLSVHHVYVLCGNG